MYHAVSDQQKAVLNVTKSFIQYRSGVNGRNTIRSMITGETVDKRKVMVSPQFNITDIHSDKHIIVTHNTNSRPYHHASSLHKTLCSVQVTNCNGRTGRLSLEK